MNLSFLNFNKIIFFVGLAQFNVFQFWYFILPTYFRFSGIFSSQPTLSWQILCKVFCPPKTISTAVASGSYIVLIIESTPFLVSHLSLRFILKPRYFFQWSDVHLVHVQLVDHQYLDHGPLFSSGVFLLGLLWNFPAVADEFYKFKPPFLTHTNSILDQLYCHFFTFYRFEHVINLKVLL